MDLKDVMTVTDYLDTVALFAVVALSMATSVTLLVRVLARELGESPRR